MQADVLNGGEAGPATGCMIRAAIAELLSKAINKHALDEELSQEDATRLADFLHGFGDLNASGNYVGTTRAGFTTPRGAGPAQSAVHKPLKLNELLAADFSKGEFYEEQIDWQATMFQPVGGMDRIPHAFAKSLDRLIDYNCHVTEITTGDRSVTLLIQKQAFRRRSLRTSASARCPSQF